MIIQLSTKALKVDDNTVILRTTEMADADFKDARRVIHIPDYKNGKIGVGLPETPVIVLFRDESSDELEKIVEQLIQNNNMAKAEFPNPAQACTGPIECINSNGKMELCDPRIQWC